jgi:hypothetical protein
MLIDGHANLEPSKVPLLNIDPSIQCEIKPHALLVASMPRLLLLIEVGRRFDVFAFCSVMSDVSELHHNAYLRILWRNRWGSPFKSGSGFT